jgi:hypothetical protein
MSVDDEAAAELNVLNPQAVRTGGQKRVFTGTVAGDTVILKVIELDVNNRQEAVERAAREVERSEHGCDRNTIQHALLAGSQIHRWG